MGNHNAKDSPEKHTSDHNEKMNEMSGTKEHDQTLQLNGKQVENINSSISKSQRKRKSSATSTNSQLGVGIQQQQLDSSTPVTQGQTPVSQQTPKAVVNHMIFSDKNKFARMYDMEIKGESKNYVYFEPKPFDTFDDSTLEGCLRQ